MARRALTPASTNRVRSATASLRQQRTNRDRVLGKVVVNEMSAASAAAAKNDDEQPRRLRPQSAMANAAVGEVRRRRTA